MNLARFPDASDEIITGLIVNYLMVSTDARFYHLSVSHEIKSSRFLKGMQKVVPDYNPGHPVGPAPIPYDWVYKARIGISTRDPDRARAWILEAMRAGYCVSRESRRRDGNGIAMGLPEFVRRRRRERIAYEAEWRARGALTNEEARDRKAKTARHGATV